jgi:hypothetical protein
VVPTIEKPDAPATPPPSVKPTKVAEEPKGYSYTSPKIDFEKGKYNK